MPLAEDFYSSPTSTSVTVDGQENIDNLLNGPERKKLRHSVVQNLELVPTFSRQHQHQHQQHTTNRRFSDNYNLLRHRGRRVGTQRTAVVNSFTMQGYRAQQSYVVDFEQAPAPAQTQTYTPYALPVCYAPVCCAPHMPVNRWGTFPSTAPTPCSCTSGLQVLTSCDSVACTAASHAGTLSVPFIHYHGIPVPYHCPHFHPHRLPPPSQTPSVIPVSFASSVYPTPTFQPGAVSTVYHQQQQQQQQHRGYHSNHQQQQQPTSFHGHPVPVASASQPQPSAYHSHQAATAQQPTGYHGSHVTPQQSGNYHNSQVAAQQPSASYHSHHITSQPSVYLHQSTGHIIPAPGQNAHQVNDEISGADATLQTPLIHPVHQQSVNAAAAAITGQPLQHAATTAVPPPWLLPLPHNDLLAAQVPQYRSVSSARQRWRTYPPVATPYSGYLLHFLAMLGRPTVVSATLPHHRVSLQNDDFTDLDSYEALLSLAERLGEVKSRGLSKPDIEKLQCYRFESVANSSSDRTSVGDDSSSVAATAAAASASRLDQTSCVVCLCDFEPRQMVRILPCRHEFHARCVDRWLKTNRTCPLCRADVTETTKMDVE